MNTNPIPNLTPRDSQLLTAFLTAEVPLAELAQRAKVPLADLMAWLDSPPIQAAIATYTRLTDLALGLTARRARAAAVETLRQLLTLNQDPVEHRRVATALIRATTPHTPRRARSDQPAAPEAEPYPDAAAPATATRTDLPDARAKADANAASPDAPAPRAKPGAAPAHAQSRAAPQSANPLRNSGATPPIAKDASSNHSKLAAHSSHASPPATPMAA